ncbi:hypothetical protein [Halorussus litoreus]|uniref:hypothetical protein n=1 Tax=Halorussus litoreus TaxID=1710536 RepID=UPI0013001C5D|nr:hypothetical protein [Halorussus litoreus]
MEATDEDTLVDDERVNTTRKSLLAELGQKSDRRGFLKRAFGGLGVTLASTFGISGTAVGHGVEKRDERMAAASSYHDTERVRQALETSAFDTLTQLSNRDYLDSASVSELPVDELYESVEEFGSASEGTMVFGVLRDGDSTVRIEVKRRVSPGELKVVVLPERNRSFAVVSEEEVESPFDSMKRKETISTSSDCLCGACYPNDYCGISCSPTSCGCLVHHVPSECCNDCCYTGDPCNGCAESYC